MDYKSYIASRLHVDGVSTQEIAELIAQPPTRDMGDYALPCFRFAKALRKSPVVIATELAADYPTDGVVTEVQAVNGYLNFTVDRKAYAVQTLAEIREKGCAFGGGDDGAGKTICIDYSSINVAKPFHIGHLSTTVLGGALYRIYKFLGYNTVGINHLGDYGTQFGKLISAYRRWGDEKAVQEGRVHELMRLYVRYHEEAEKHPEMDDEARAYFKMIENGDEECNRLFNWFKELTLIDVEKIYKQLDIHFDSYAGESFYIDKMAPVIEELEQKGLLTVSEGAKVVDLEKYDMPPCLILKADGATIYATRDLAAAVYRKNTYDFDKCLYVVAYQQNLHFKQVFKVLELMDKDWAKDMVHVAYGMVSLEEGTMSTRKGNVVLLEDVIQKCVDKAYAIIDQKNPNLENKQDVAEKVGVGAVIFGALANNKIKDIVFSYDKVMNFDGETGPYVQYTCARANSVLLKAGEKAGAYDLPELSDEEYALVDELARFPEVVRSAAEKYEPSFVTRYAVGLASAFNKFYLGCKILQETGDVKNFRLDLTAATLQVLKNALSLLGIGVPERM